LLLAVGLVAVLVFPDQATAVGPIAVLVGFLATAITLTRKSRALAGGERVAWMTIGVGFSVASVGMLSFGVVEMTAGPLPAFGPIDLLFIAAYSVVLFGFSILPHRSKRPGERIRTYLDGLIGAVAVAVVAWVLFLDDVLRGFSDASGWERWVGSAYPILDMASLIVLLLLGARRTALRFDPRLMWFGAGLVVQVAADVSYLRRGIGLSFEEAQPNFSLFIVAAACYFTAARLLDHRFKHREYADRPASAWAMIGPYAAAGFAVTVATVRVASTDLPTGTRTLLRMITVMVALVILRQAVAIRENSRVVARQRAQLVASVSHELRTPLTAIVGYLDILEGAADLAPAERAEITAIASQQSRYMATLVSDLVDMGSEGHAPIKALDRVEDVATLVARSVHGVEMDQVRVGLEVEPGLRAYVDARRVQQVVVNLLSNAVRYGDNSVLVRATSDGAALVIEVHDNGPGVPRRWELAIWDRFERGTHRFSARQGGTGLGLAVVADIAAAYRGTTECTRSERLGGALFRVVFPNRVVRRRTEALAPAV
jgi:signal transduction histidine kinase